MQLLLFGVIVSLVRCLLQRVHARIQHEGALRHLVVVLCVTIETSDATCGLDTFLDLFGEDLAFLGHELQVGFSLLMGRRQRLDLSLMRHLHLLLLGCVYRAHLVT